MYKFLDFLTETTNNTQRIYCDMDGVLADFETGIEQQFNMNVYDWMKLKYKDRWAMVYAKKNFWKDLPWNKGGKQLWNFVKKYDVHILSAGTADASTKRGKREWLKKNTGLSPADPKIHIVLRNEKKRFAKTANGTPNILIDDYGKNIKDWEAKGGIGVKHDNTAKTIAKLRKLLKK